MEDYSMWIKFNEENHTIICRQSIITIWDSNNIQNIEQ